MRFIQLSFVAFTIVLLVTSVRAWWEQDGDDTELYDRRLTKQIEQIKQRMAKLQVLAKQRIIAELNSAATTEPPSIIRFLRGRPYRIKAGESPSKEN